jgi:t-SNARE complex subunit (syntaxin)
MIFSGKKNHNAPRRTHFKRLSWSVHYEFIIIIIIIIIVVVVVVVVVGR